MKMKMKKVLQQQTTARFVPFHRLLLARRQQRRRPEPHRAQIQIGAQLQPQLGP